MQTTLRRIAIGIATGAGAWALAQAAAAACPVGKPVLAGGSPGLAVRADAEEGRPLCRVRFSSGVELAYEASDIVPATPEHSRTPRPVPGANMAVASALKAGARLCRPGADVIYQDRRATVLSVRTEDGQRVCTLRPDGAPTISLRSTTLEAPENLLVPAG